VLFPHRYSAESPRVEIKNLADGSQVEVELESWLKSSGGPTASPAP
jgi:hypothetical protein